jgi:hypothetical protein
VLPTGNVGIGWVCPTSTLAMTGRPARTGSSAKMAASVSRDIWLAR